MFTACFTPAFTLLGPPFLAWLAHKKSARFRQARGLWLALMMWLVALVPLCGSMMELVIYMVGVQPYSMAISSVADVPYADEINQAATRNGLDPALLAAVVEVESGFNRNAVGAAGEVGLMQLMPMTAAMLNVADRTDVAQNLDGGARYLRMMLDRYGRLDLALAAYNAGPGHVDSCHCVPGNQGYVTAVATAYDRYQSSETYSTN